MGMSLAEYTHPELVNLATDLDDDELGNIAAQCTEEFKYDWESGQQWREMHADWLRLYFQKDKAKNPPWEGASEESIPMLSEACVQFRARGSKALFPSDKVITAAPIGKVDEQSKERAERVSTHMSWQLIHKHKGYKRDKKRLLTGLPLHGSFFVKTYYDPLLKRNVNRNVRPTDFVVPYGTGSRDLEDIDRKSEIIPITVNQSKYLVNTGYFIKEPLPYEKGEENQADEAHNEAQGTQPSPLDKSVCRLIEQHRLLDLDDDGLPEPYIVTLDAQSEEVLRIAVRYDTDEIGEPTEFKEPIEYYTHYMFMENPDGFYGLGYGHLIGQINIAVNKLLRQTIDAGTLANILQLSGFIDKSIDIKGGETRLQLGKFLKTTSSREDLARGIWQPSIQGVQPVLPELMQMLMGRGDRLASTTEAITGQTERVMQPTTVLALLEQSMEVFSSSYESVLDSWGEELEKNYRLNRKFMDPKEYFAVQDASGEFQAYSASREDYADDHQITPLADPKLFVEKQKLTKAEMIYNFAMTNPLVAQSPIHLREAARRYLEAIGERDINALLPDARPVLPRVDDPQQENMGAISPVPHMPPAFPDQDHRLHIEAHNSLLLDPVYGPKLTPSGVAVLEEHIQAHIAMMYGMTESETGGLADFLGSETPDESLGGAVSTPTGMGADDIVGGAEPIEGAATDIGISEGTA